jgi:hypothetical protein
MEAIKTISPKIEEMLKASWFKEGLKNEQGLVTKFDRDVWTTWREPLELLWLVIDLACKSAENVNSLSQEAEPEHPHLREVMTRLHTRGVRIAKEILVLLRNGFADGAAARWRTLHETTVVAFFVWEHGEECAQQFLAHDAVELHRAAGAYARCCDKLGYDPMPQEEAALLEKEYQEVIEEFGPDFKKEYGWATKFLGKKRVFFSDLESAVDFDSMRFDYGQASHEVHVSARSLLAHLGLVEENTLLAGPSIHGLSQAGSNTARSLILLSATCVQVHPIMDAFISSYVMMLLAGEAHASFASIESKLTAEATPVE